MAQSIKTRLAMANGMNSRLCHLAKEEINRIEKKGNDLRNGVAFVVNYMDTSDAAYTQLLSLIEEFDK